MRFESISNKQGQLLKKLKSLKKKHVEEQAIRAVSRQTIAHARLDPHRE
jgi:hypothetical protein